ncbi:MAG: hypothetical protein PHO13_06310 [Fermentimonas sp.]|nr:hypothetical protein [Fermentimonas sp.]MDD3189095.1 hypothetical protein [Fermentimonas sp.]MDD4723697.1 hypothetical protein [Fermentimonas sp.]
MKWKVRDELTDRGYKFSYDGLNRLTTATYGEGASLSANLNRFDESITAYDKMGNILAMQRQGKLDSGYGLMDNLTYTYTGNRLTKVSDVATAPITYPGAFHFNNALFSTDFLKKELHKVRAILCQYTFCDCGFWVKQER